MAWYPYFDGAKTNLIVVPLDATAEEKDRLVVENRRRWQVKKRRMYFDGDQYDEENEQARAACGLPWWARMPEHERKHAYSTEIAEAVTFIADQLADGFRLEATDARVEAVIQAMVANTEALSGEDDPTDLTCDDVLRDALTAGDTPVELVWNPLEQCCFLQFWESEQVDFDVPYANVVRKVTLQTSQWVTDTDGVVKNVQQREVYEVVDRLPETGELETHKECRKQVFWDADDTPRRTEWLGIPMLPWALLRGDKKKLTGVRGDSLITDQAMDTADRYNAVEQLSFLIARYNSHGNVVVTGDGATLQLQEDKRVQKDVADVLQFPGATNVFGLTLPTDAQMIEHQRQVLANSLFKSFGLARVEPDTLAGLSQVSGYALEILNRKTDGTFRRVRRTWKKDWLRLINQVLDFTAYRQAAQVSPLALEAAGIDEEMLNDPEFTLPDDLAASGASWWEVEPELVFPNREIEIAMGSGYIVDDVMVRDDFTAKLIPQREALRQRGYSEEEIDRIMQEQEDEAPPPPEATLLGGVSQAGAVRPAGTAAGSTVGSTARQ